MITPAYAQLMANYNRWQNQRIYATADMLQDEQRKLDQGAFFGSIHGTLNHLLWADQTWLHRFAGTAAPSVKRPRESTTMFAQWDDLKRERQAFDETIIGWTNALDDAWLAGDITWFSGAVGREISRPRWRIVSHFFNHQTHHRGQVHAMLTRLGTRLEATDLMLME